MNGQQGIFVSNTVHPNYCEQTQCKLYENSAVIIFTL